MLGAVDGTLIPFKAPSEDKHLYVTRKGFHGINLQGICDSANIFANLVGKWPISSHDAYILRNSRFLTYLKRGKYKMGGYWGIVPTV